ncbi:hypothetical protein [Clostridium estertheticum]|uniref:hypothetical protein n=1 Tax=Clostridium estertheticum TaxID=238834 RepID=UPI001C0DC48A|nr:hypothetical protein [Clostridium estertheticum]MBU3171333.1 hypothetical protein [Clostridium estertheticum]
MGKKVVHLKKSVKPVRYSMGGEKKMVYSDTKEIGCIIQLLARLQSLKLKVVENITTLTHTKVDEDVMKFNEFELLMKECYINNTERHRSEAEESLMFANEAEQAFKNSDKEWSDL